MNTIPRLIFWAILGATGLSGCAATGNSSRNAALASQERPCNVGADGEHGLRDADTASPSRCYTHDDISRTGATTLGGALPLLDPSITVRR
jgi:hypothetical protein